MRQSAMDFARFGRPPKIPSQQRFIQRLEISKLTMTWLAALSPLTVFQRALRLPSGPSIS
jgi:hypothetical protein